MMEVAGKTHWTCRIRVTETLMILFLFFLGPFLRPFLTVGLIGVGVEESIPIDKSDREKRPNFLIRFVDWN